MVSGSLSATAVAGFAVAALGLTFFGGFDVASGVGAATGFTSKGLTSKISSSLSWPPVPLGPANSIIGKSSPFMACLTSSADMWSLMGSGRASGGGGGGSLLFFLGFT